MVLPSLIWPSCYCQRSQAEVRSNSQRRAEPVELSKAELLLQPWLLAPSEEAIRCLLVRPTSLFSDTCIQSRYSSLEWPVSSDSWSRVQRSNQPAPLFPPCSGFSFLCHQTLHLLASGFPYQWLLQPPRGFSLTFFVCINWCPSSSLVVSIVSIGGWNKQVCLYNRSSFITYLTGKIQELNLLSNLHHLSG